MFKVIEVEKIRSGKNIRNEMDDGINELMQSIQVNGLINPILVKRIAGGKYEVIAGHRRFEAVKRLRQDFIECNIVEEELSDKDVVLQQIAENVQRKDMSAVELVDCFDDLKNRFGVKQYQIAKLFNKSDKWVSYQYSAVKMLDQMYGDKSVIPEDVKKKTASQIKNTAKKKMSGDDENILCKGMSVKVKGHVYTITCVNNATENALRKFIETRKL